LAESEPWAGKVVQQKSKRSCVMSRRVILAIDDKILKQVYLINGTSRTQGNDAAK
jgi:hypothetical protein